MDDFSRILVIRHKYLGDVVLATPVLRALRQNFPQASITFLTRQAYAPLLEGHACIDTLVALSHGTVSVTLLRKLRTANFDLVLDFTSTWRSALLALATGARYRVGRTTTLLASCYTARVHAADYPDALTASLAFVESLGIEAAGRQPQVALAPDERDWARLYLRSGGIDSDRPLVAIHPYSRWQNKIWPFEHLVELVHRLHAQDCQVILIQGNPDEAPRLQRLMDAVPNAVLCADNLPLRKLAALLAEAGVLVSSYSGLLHLAVAAGTRAIGIFGPDDAAFWFPYSADDGHRAISEALDCQPCGLTYCPLGTLACLQQISVDRVFEAIMESLVATP